MPTKRVFASACAIALVAVIARAAVVAPAPHKGAASAKQSQATTKPSFQYHFKEGQNLYYDVKISVEGPGYIDSYTGTSRFEVKSVDPRSGEIAIEHSMDMLASRHVLTPTFQLPRIYNIDRKIDLTIDPFGNWKKTSSREVLPFLLQPACNMMIITISHDSDPWETHMAGIVHPYGGAASGDASQPGGIANIKQSTIFQTVSQENGIYVLRSLSRAQSEEQSELQPTVKEMGVGQLQFDQNQGLVNWSNVKFVRSERLPGMTVATTVTFTARLLSPSEVAGHEAQRQQAANQAAAARRQHEKLVPISETTADGLLAQLSSSNPSVVRDAAYRFAHSVPLESRRWEVAAALEKQLDRPDSYTAEYAVRALGFWGDGGSVPALIKLLSHSDPFVRRSSIAALGSLKGDEAIHALATHLTLSIDRSSTAAALKMMGSSVERHLWQPLLSADAGTRVAICEILAAVGTQSSIEFLARTQMNENSLVAAKAGEAIESIKKRDNDRENERTRDPNAGNDR